MDVLGPFVSLCRALGRIAVEVAEGSSIDLVRTEFLGRIAERDTRMLAIQVLLGVLRGHTEEEVNEVNAPAIAEERGIGLAETKRTQVRDYADLIRVSVFCGEDSVRVRAGRTVVRGRQASVRIEVRDPNPERAAVRLAGISCPPCRPPPAKRGPSSPRSRS